MNLSVEDGYLYLLHLQLTAANCNETKSFVCSKLVSCPLHSLICSQEKDAEKTLGQIKFFCDQILLLALPLSVADTGVGGRRGEGGSRPET